MKGTVRHRVGGRRGVRHDCLAQLMGSLPPRDPSLEFKFAACEPKRGLSDVVILDAQDFAGEPLATIRLPVRVARRVPRWAPDVTAASVA